MYEVSLAETWERFGSHLDGAYASPVLVVSGTPLPDNARNALESSVAALGYGKNACTFLVVEPIGRSEGADATHSGAKALSTDKTFANEKDASVIEAPSGAAPASAAGALFDGSLFAAIEGLDPMAMIIADRAAVSACSQAYRCDISAPDKNRMLGRDVIAFDDFASLLANPQDKQRAWGLLKRLPRLDS